ncbi:hypothetical protein AVEN_239633-1, partial [Araneus ventricosus]
MGTKNILWRYTPLEFGMPGPSQSSCPVPGGREFGCGLHAQVILSLKSELKEFQQEGSVGVFGNLRFDVL